MDTREQQQAAAQAVQDVVDALEKRANIVFACAGEVTPEEALRRLKAGEFNVLPCAECGQLGVVFVFLTRGRGIDATVGVCAAHAEDAKRELGFTHVAVAVDPRGEA